MVFDIIQLKKIRTKLDLTQQRFAKEVGVSQSMIAKIESGRLDPTYSYVKKIEEAVERLSKIKEDRAGEVMNKRVVTVGSKESLKKVIELMTKHGFSQIPVVDRGNVVGLVTESDLLEDGVGGRKVGEVMKESPPIVSESAEMSVLVGILKFYPIVLVKEKGELKGVVTKSDVLQRL